jgi:hypothetical protein
MEQVAVILVQKSQVGNLHRGNIVSTTDFKLKSHTDGMFSGAAAPSARINSSVRALIKLNDPKLFSGRSFHSLRTGNVAGVITQIGGGITAWGSEGVVRKICGQGIPGGLRLDTLTVSDPSTKREVPIASLSHEQQEVIARVLADALTRVQTSGWGKVAQPLTHRPVSPALDPSWVEVRQEGFEFV